MSRGKPPVATKAKPAAALVVAKPALPAETKKPHKPHVEYSQELVEVICDRIAGGEVLEKILAEEGMPSRKGFYLWRLEHPDAQAAFQSATEVRCERFMEETVTIADEPMRTKEEIAAAKLRVNTRMLYAEKILPRIYGTKIGIGGADGLPPVRTETQVDLDVTLTAAEAYKRIIHG